MTSRKTADSFFISVAKREFSRKLDLLFHFKIRTVHSVKLSSDYFSLVKFIFKINTCTFIKYDRKLL